MALVITACRAAAADGLVAVKSPYDVKETMNRLEDLAKQRGLTIFARVDHAAGAAKIGKTLRPTEVLIFGNPQGGTPLMECAQTAGIDLPFKELVWKDVSNGSGWATTIRRIWHSGTAPCPAAGNIDKALSTLAAAVVAR